MRIPENLSPTWCRGGKSFTEVIRWHNKGNGRHEPIIENQFFGNGHQLSEGVFALSFLYAYKLALDYPGEKIQWVRFDHEGEVAENPNNAPFRGDTKVYKFADRVQDISGKVVTNGRH